MKPLLMICAFTVLGLWPVLPCWPESEPTGREILARIDEVAAAPRDQEMEATLILTDERGHRKQRTIRMYQKGADKRLAIFLEPADQRGISVLSLPDSLIYLYLPAFKQVKRIASHVKHRNFAGTDFSYEDMEAKRFSDHYRARLTGSDRSFYHLELTPLDPDSSQYSRLRMGVRKDNFVPVSIEYYDRGGNRFKELTSSRIERIDGYWVVREREMVDLRRNHRTRMIVERIHFDAGLPDRIFTQRYLRQQQGTGS